MSNLKYVSSTSVQSIEEPQKYHYNLEVHH